MKRELAALALIVGAILLFGHAIIGSSASPFRGDIPLQFYPWKCYTRAALASGEIPYWNPYTYGGAPFLANIQSAVFYPLDLILFLFPMEWFFGLSLLLHLGLAGIGAYLLARRCGATSFPSSIAGIAYGLNGFTMIHIPAGNHLTYAGATWTPWMLWATAGFILTSGSRLPWALGGTFITCLHFLCGHPQMSFYSLFFSCLFCLVLGFWVERLKDQPNYWAPVIRAGVWPFFLLLGIALCGMQLVPALQYMGEANRAAGLSLEAATEFSFAPHRLIALFCPDFYGTMIRGTHYDSFVYWSCAYAGLMVPLLAIILLARSPKRFSAAVPLAIIACSGLLFAWGRGNPFYAMIYQLPGFGYFRAPAKYLPYYLAPICVLAALGVEYLGNRAYEKLNSAALDPTRKAIRSGFALAFAIGLAATLFFWGIPYLSDQAVRAQLSALNAPSVERIAGIERQVSFERLSVLLVAGALAYGIARLTPKAPRLVLSGALAFVLFLDLNYFGQSYLSPSLVKTDAIRASTIPPAELGAIRSPRASSRPDRVMNRKDLDFPNVLMHWRLNNLAGYDPMSLKTYNRQIGLLEGWKAGDYHDNIQLAKTNHPVLDLLDVRYVLTREELNDPALSPVVSGKDFRIYERRSPNRCWASIRTLESGMDGGQWSPADSSIEIKKYSPHEIIFSYSSDAPVRMRTAEWNYPGWRAEATRAGGSKANLVIEPSNEGLRTFIVPAGVQEIRLFYKAPWSGWILTGLSGIVFVLLTALAIAARTDLFLRFMQKVMGRNF